MKQIFTLKGFITIIFIILTVIAIYYVFDPKQKTYIAMGDSFTTGKNADNEYKYGYPDYVRDYYNNERALKYFNKTYAIDDYTIKEMKKDLENNDFKIIEGNTISIKRLLRESDVLTITIGINDIFSYLNINDILDLEYKTKEQINEALRKTKKDLESLIKEINKYAKGKIVFVGYYFPGYRNYQNIFYTVNNLNYMYQDLASRYNFIYCKTTNLFNEDKKTTRSLYPNYKIYKKIAFQLIKITKK